jgi:hypothetical protein
VKGGNVAAAVPRSAAAAEVEPVDVDGDSGAAERTHGGVIDGVDIGTQRDGRGPGQRGDGRSSSIARLNDQVGLPTKISPPGPLSSRDDASAPYASRAVSESTAEIGLGS